VVAVHAQIINKDVQGNGNSCTLIICRTLGVKLGYQWNKVGLSDIYIDGSLLLGLFLKFLGLDY